MSTQRVSPHPGRHAQAWVNKGAESRAAGREKLTGCGEPGTRSRREAPSRPRRRGGEAERAVLLKVRNGPVGNSSVQAGFLW